MWGGLRSLGESVTKLTQDVLLEINETGDDYEALPDDIVSDGDTAEFTADEAPEVLCEQIARLQDKVLCVCSMMYMSSPKVYARPL